MVIPRLLSRSTSSAAQRAHFQEVLSAAPPATRGDLQQPVLRLRNEGGFCTSTCAATTPISLGLRSLAERTH